jgi:sarcosine oxidase
MVKSSQHVNDLSSSGEKSQSVPHEILPTQDERVPSVSKTDYQTIVIGGGGIGSAALYWLARQTGGDVLGLEQFRLGHSLGSSQDHSRIIRLSYHAPEYAELAPHTYITWRELEAESGLKLIHQTGGIQFGPRELGEISKYAAAMTKIGVPFEQLSREEAACRFPQFRFRDSDQILFQASDGFIDPRMANAAHANLARARGAAILEDTRVERVKTAGEDVIVHTTRGHFSARSLIVTAGAWTNHVLEGLGIKLPLSVTEEQVTYFATPHLRDFTPQRFPIWVWHGDHVFYGFPVYGEVATKAGQDVGGDTVTVESRKLEPNPRCLDNLTRFLAERIPEFLGPQLYTKPCLYTLTPDRNFILDKLPDHPNIAVAVGAGHGYKFAALFGRILSDLTLHNSTPFPIQAFSLTRPAITNPSYPQTLAI